jgi:cyclophilin family peptidyl-prolyl cis-trans isomerase
MMANPVFAAVKTHSDSARRTPAAGTFDLQSCEARLLMSATIAHDSAVVFDTTVGQIVVALDPTAPQTVANFVKYVDAKLYDGTVVHRAVSDFVVQGGGFKPSGSSYVHIPTFAPVVNEFSTTRPNVRGTVAMAKVAGDPNSATSEFFFNVADNRANLDGQNGGFTVFANVIRGMGIVDLIEGLQKSSVSATTNGTATTLSDFPKVLGFLDVKINSAVKRDLATVTIGAGSTDKAVRFKDGDKTLGEISLSGPGAASLKLTAVAGMTVSHEGGFAVVRGADLKMQGIDVTGTDLRSNLILNGSGGRNHAIDVGDINVTGAIGGILGSTANVGGDVNLSGGARRLNLLAVTNAGTITIGSTTSPIKAMPVDVTIGFLSNASFKSVQPVSRLLTQAWESTDLLGRTFTAPSIGTLNSYGTQNAQGRTVGFGVDLNVPGRIQSIGMRIATGSITAGSIGSATIGILSGGGLTATGAAGIGSVNLSQANSATIRSVGNIGRVTAGTMKDTSILAGVSSSPAFGKFPVATPATSTTAAVPVFSNPTARIDSVRVTGGPMSFTGSRIAAPTVGSASLGRVATILFTTNTTTGAKTPDTTTETGIKADKIGSLSGVTQDGQPLNLRNLDTQAAADAIVTARKLKLNRFSVVLV